jgi:hypothetical protein
VMTGELHRRSATTVHYLAALDAALARVVGILRSAQSEWGTAPGGPSSASDCAATPAVINAPVFGGAADGSSGSSIRPALPGTLSERKANRTSYRRCHSIRPTTHGMFLVAVWWRSADPSGPRQSGGVPNSQRIPHQST